jgi:hypothetical protein
LIANLPSSSHRKQGSHGSSCRVEEFWQQQGEAGGAGRDLFGEPVHPLP